MNVPLDRVPRGIVTGTTVAGAARGLESSTTTYEPSPLTPHTVAGATSPPFSVV